MITTVKSLLNGASKSLSVNGASTPVTFSYSPGEGNIVQVISLSILLKDEGDTSFNKFGAISALTNGLLIQYSVDGVEKTLVTLKDNADIANAFPHNQHFGNSAVLELLGIVNAQGFGKTNNVFKGELKLNTPVILKDTDYISAVVQDNLSNIDVLQISTIVEEE
jgi:hypothetical protein